MLTCIIPSLKKQLNLVNTNKLMNYRTILCGSFCIHTNITCVIIIYMEYI